MAWVTDWHPKTQLSPVKYKVKDCLGWIPVHSPSLTFTVLCPLLSAPLAGKLPSALVTHTESLAKGERLEPPDRNQVYLAAL